MGLPAQPRVQNRACVDDRACVVPQDHALPAVDTSERRLTPMAVQHRDTVCPGVSGPPQRSRANPSGLRSVHCALGPVRCQVDGLQTQPGDDGTRSHFFFKFSFNLILFFGHTMWHAGPSSQTRNQTHAPELEVCEVPTTGQPGSLHP